MTSAAAEDPSFDDFFVAHFAGVERAVTYVVGNRQVAEEITQDAFIKLLQRWSRICRYDRPDLWVRRVALRDAYRERRRGWKRRTVEAHAGKPETVQPSDNRHDEVFAALASLGPKQRAVVVLYYYEDRPMEQIADILECSISTCWSQLHNARQRLKVILREEVAGDVS